MKIKLTLSEEQAGWLLDSLEADIERMSGLKSNPDSESLKRAEQVYDILWKAMT